MMKFAHIAIAASLALGIPLVHAQTGVQRAEQFHIIA